MCRLVTTLGLNLQSLSLTSAYYKINDFGRILIDDPASTKMFCFPPNENVEMNTDIILDFLTSNDLDLKSADGTPENIFFESENKKLYLKLID